MSISACECIASANETLAAHSALVSRIRATQKYHRRELRTLASPPYGLLKLPLIESPPRSPSPSPPSSPVLLPKSKPHRPDLPPAKRARVARYNNYVPEEETIRNDYSQRYVDGGEWPQNWVLGADPDHRFEEFVPLMITKVTRTGLIVNYWYMQVSEATKTIGSQESLSCCSCATSHLPSLFRINLVTFLQI